MLILIIINKRTYMAAVSSSTYKIYWEIPDASKEILDLLEKVDALRIEEENEIVSPEDNSQKINEKMNKIIAEGLPLLEEIFTLSNRDGSICRRSSLLHEACWRHQPRFINLLKDYSHLVNRYMPQQGRSLEVVVSNLAIAKSEKESSFGEWATNLLSRQTIPYTIEKDPRLALKPVLITGKTSLVWEVPVLNPGEKPPLGDRVTLLIKPNTRVAVQKPANELDRLGFKTEGIDCYTNVILKAAYYGKTQVFRNVLRPLYEPDLLRSLEVGCSPLPIEIRQIVADYSCVVTDSVRDAVTLTYSTIPIEKIALEDEDEVGEEPQYTTYKTPLMEVFQGFWKHQRDRFVNNDEDRTGEYLQLAKFILDCGEQPRRCPSKMRESTPNTWNEHPFITYLDDELKKYFPGILARIMKATPDELDVYVKEISRIALQAVQGDQLSVSMREMAQRHGMRVPVHLNID